MAKNITFNGDQSNTDIDATQTQTIQAASVEIPQKTDIIPDVDLGGMKLQAENILVELKMQEQEKLDTLLRQLQCSNQMMHLEMQQRAGGSEVQKQFEAYSAMSNVTDLQALSLENGLLPPLAGMEKIRAIQQSSVDNMLNTVSADIAEVDNQPTGENS